MKECVICCEDYEEENGVNCLFCQTEICSHCVQQYLLGTNQTAHCMQCKKPWSREFMVTNLGKKWMLKEWKQHCEDVLLDRERSLLPASQEYAEKEKQRRVYEKESEDLKKAIEHTRTIYHEKYPIIGTYTQKLADLSKDYMMVRYPGTNLVPKWVQHRRCPFCRMEVDIGIDAATGCGIFAKPPSNGAEASGSDGTSSVSAQVLTVQKKSNKIDCNRCGSYYCNDCGRFLRKTMIDIHICNDYDKDYEVKRKKIFKEYNALIKSDEYSKYYRYRTKMENEIGELEFKERLARSKMNAVFRGEVNPEKKSAPVVRNCPQNNCRGFLSSGWKCGLCGINVCAQCHEVKDRDEEGKLKPHECNPDAVETAKLINKETRPCPSCNSIIFKVSGCDQMWCTQCNTAFSWSTRTIITSGTIHNPHYFEYLRARGEEAPRMEEGQMNCDTLVSYYQLSREFRKNPDKQIPLCHHIYRAVAEAGELREKYAQNRMRDNLHIRARYLLGDYDDKRFKQVLQMRSKAAEKMAEIYQILDTFYTVASGLFRELINTENTATIAVQFSELRDYINESLQNISKIYDCKVPRIDDEWYLHAVGERKQNWSS